MILAHDRHGSAIVTLPSDTEIMITRQFDAPASLVFKAWTTPELVKRWWGFETSRWLVCEIDLRVGGRWRYVTREAKGFEVAFHGVFQVVEAPHRLVSTEVFEPFPDAESLNTITFDEERGVTTMTAIGRYRERKHRDAHIASGMEGGMQVSMNRLEDLVVGMARAPGIQ